MKLGRINGVTRRQLLIAISKFESLARAEEMAGMYAPEEADYIKANYRYRRKRLRKMVAQLFAEKR